MAFSNQISLLFSSCFILWRQKCYGLQAKVDVCTPFNPSYSSFLSGYSCMPIASLRCPLPFLYLGMSDFSVIDVRQTPYTQKPSCCQPSCDIWERCENKCELILVNVAKNLPRVYIYPCAAWFPWWYDNVDVSAGAAWYAAESGCVFLCRFAWAITLPPLSAPWQRTEAENQLIHTGVLVSTSRFCLPRCCRVHSSFFVFLFFSFKHLKNFRQCYF